MTNMTRFKITKPGDDFQFDIVSGKSGKKGHIKKATWLGRKIRIGNEYLNRGSLIDFINSKRSPTEKKLKKGWFFGCGAKDSEVRDRLNAIFDKPSEPSSNKPSEETLAILKGVAPPIPKPNRTEMTYEELLENSTKFQEVIKMPTIDNQIAEMSTKADQIAVFANETHPFISKKVWVLAHNFLELKKIHGTDKEKELYATLTLPEFFDRLITKRPVVFYLPNDVSLLQDGTRITGGFEKIGSDQEESPLTLQDYLSYDEMQISAYLSQSTPTHFINKGDRHNLAKKSEDPNTFEETGIYYGMVGARFEKMGFMEDEFAMIRKNTLRDPNKAAIWSQFFEIDHFPSYAEAESDPTRFVKNGNAYFDKVIYKAIMKARIEAFLIDADERGEVQGKPAYVRIVGLGLGVWAPDEIKKILAEIQREIYQEVILDKKLENIGVLEFNYFPDLEKPIPPSIEMEDNTIPIISSKRNPADIVPDGYTIFYRLKKADIVPDGYLLCAQYAWDGNSFPGNEYWINALSASGDPAAICCSTVGELQNPLINPNARGPNLRVY